MLHLNQVFIFSKYIPQMENKNVCSFEITFSGLREVN